MGGVDHEHGVKLEADGPRLDVADAGEQQDGEQIAITQPALDFRADFLQQSLARRVLKETD